MNAKFQTDGDGSYLINIGPTRPTHDEYREATEAIDALARVMADDFADGINHPSFYIDRYRRMRREREVLCAAYFAKTYGLYEGSGAGERCPRPEADRIEALVSASTQSLDWEGER
jgi:hypothetical protein